MTTLHFMEYPIKPAHRKLTSKGKLRKTKKTGRFNRRVNIVA